MRRKLGKCESELSNIKRSSPPTKSLLRLPILHTQLKPLAFLFLPPHLRCACNSCHFILLAMEATLKLRLSAVAMIAVVMASSLVEKAVAAEAPAPSPASGATSSSTAAAAVASLAALAFGHLFC
ncbi:hypothetical protein Cni_G13716 [Canna indica]|uniref:Uncharacterized protein n=1 Tax=Canna indica TaxID=4628 RepID=A0AAQ3QDA7_9LILI|nr:hypothetical protein Cni_G13716 [Canna indica]